MKATIYYIELSHAQHDELNSDPKGWNSQIGHAYLNARDGKIDFMNFDLFVKAATMEAHRAENVWIAMQNGEQPWATARPEITSHTRFTRSMDVGDIIIWEDGTRERCAAQGFETICGPRGA